MMHNTHKGRDMVLLFQLRHGLDGLLDGSLSVQAVAVIQVDGLDAQALQTLRTRLLDVFRIRADLPLALGCRVVGELGRQEDFVPLPGSLEPFADQVFVVVVHVCGIPERLPEFVGPVQDLEALFVRFWFPIEGGEACQWVRWLMQCLIGSKDVTDPWHRSLG